MLLIQFNWIQFNQIIFHQNNKHIRKTKKTKQNKTNKKKHKMEEMQLKAKPEECWTPFTVKNNTNKQTKYKGKQKK